MNGKPPLGRLRWSPVRRADRMYFLPSCPSSLTLSYIPHHDTCNHYKYAADLDNKGAVNKVSVESPPKRWQINRSMRHGHWLQPLLVQFLPSDDADQQNQDDDDGDSCDTLLVHSGGSDESAGLV